MFYSTLSVKVQKSKKNGMKVSELTIKTSRLNKDLKTTQDDYSSIRCINKKAENTTSHTW